MILHFNHLMWIIYEHFEAGADQSIVQGCAYQQTVTRRNQPSLEQLIKVCNY